MNDDDHPHGLEHDLRILDARLSRRRMFGWLGAAALIPLVGCSSEDGSGVDATTGVDGTAGACSAIPEETAGPYPGDGTNGPNALTTSGIVRADIRPSFGTASGVAGGVVMTVTLTIVDKATCSPLAGHAVYLWHCDRDGNYSLYSPAVVNENYLRGVQVTDGDGKATFTTIVAGCYSGRWPHLHFEVYASLADATTGANKVAVSQLALPKAMCDVVYAEAGYSASVSNLSHVTLATDNVFSDGATLQLATVTGSVAAGYAASLMVAV